MAINPQILKRHAAGDVEGSRELLFFSCNISFYLMLAMVLPLLFEARFVLNLWLHEVPEYTTEFLQIVLLEMLVYVYDVTFYQIFQAEGRLKENAIICPIMDFVALAIIYVLYRQGGNVLWIAWGMLFLTVLQGMLVKPWLAVKLFGYKWVDFLKIFANNTIVTIASAILPFCMVLFSNHTALFNLLLIAVSIISVCINSYFIGISKEDRIKLNTIVKKRFINK